MKLTKAFLLEMLAGLEGVSAGPWHKDKHSAAVYGGGPGDGMVIYDEGGHSDADAAHIARCDPDNIRALLTEILAGREQNGN